MSTDLTKLLKAKLQKLDDHVDGYIDMTDFDRGAMWYRSEVSSLHSALIECVAALEIHACKSSNCHDHKSCEALLKLREVLDMNKENK